MCKFPKQSRFFGPPNNPGPSMMTPMPAVPDETTKAFTYSTPAGAPTPASPLDKWRDLSTRLQGK